MLRVSTEAEDSYTVRLNCRESGVESESSTQTGENVIKTAQRHSGHCIVIAGV